MITVYADGLAEPNPGRATWAFIAYDDDRKVITSQCEALPGTKTNNDAEYIAFGKALAWILSRVKSMQSAPLIAERKFLLLSDSQLVLKQVRGEWACNKDALIRYRDRCRELMAQIEAAGIELSLNWVPSEQNKADEQTRVAYKKAFGIDPPTRPKRNYETS